VRFARPSRGGGWLLRDFTTTASFVPRSAYRTDASNGAGFP
jgi:hypothetical protein